MDRCNELCTKETTGSCALCEALAERDRFERVFFAPGTEVLLLLLALLAVPVFYLVTVAVLTVWSIVSAWRYWSPMLDKLNPMIKAIWRLLGWMLSIIVGLLGYVEARLYLNALTGVDPNNFTKAVLTFTGLFTVLQWIPFFLLGYLIISIISFWSIPGERKDTVLENTAITSQPYWNEAWHFIQKRLIFSKWVVIPYVWIIIGFPLYSFLSFPKVQNLLKVIFVYTEFSHDKTCNVSSETRWVALLKDRKETTITNVLIADIQSWTDISFKIGQCNSWP